MIRILLRSTQVSAGGVAWLATLAILASCSMRVPRSDEGRAEYASSSAAAEGDIMQEAMVHVVMGLDAYSADDFSATRGEFDAAIGPLVDAGVARTWRAALRLLDARLPDGYAEFNLVKVYRDARKRAKEAGAVVEGAGVDEAEAAVGGPQGMGVPPPAKDAQAGQDEGGEDGDTPGSEGATPTGLSDEDAAFVQQEIERILEEFGETEYPHPDLFEERVLRFIELYQTDLHGFFERTMIRSAKYLPMVQEVLGEKGVPQVMAYIAFVESGFRPDAVSRAGAVGLWQFMPSTARAYGLKVGRGLDERKDPLKSTLAAREYFLDLVAIFGSRSFLLAMASYNAGEGKVQYCLKQVDDPFTQRTFWDIAPCLRRETREYIPRVIAAAIVSQDAERFGFEDAAAYLDPDRYAIVDVAVPADVAALAEACDITPDELRAMNLDLAPARSATPAPYRLLVPANKRRRVEKVLERIAKRQQEEARTASNSAAQGSKKNAASGSRRSTTTRTTRGTSKRTTSSTQAGQKRTKYIKYRVQPGNALSVIAEDFGTSVAKLKTWNPYLRKRGLQAGDTLFIYDLDWSYRKWRHKIVAGDTLGRIALTYGVTVDDIRRWNGLKGDVIQEGRRLVIYTHGKATAIAERNVTGGSTAGKGGRRPLTYVVQSGNNLSMIAAMFDVSFRDIMRWNNLSSGRIYPGQKLVIYPGQDFSEVKYRVRKGDTLIGIAKRFRLDPAYLAAINGLTNADHLEVGQELTVYRKK